MLERIEKISVKVKIKVVILLLMGIAIAWGLSATATDMYEFQLGAEALDQGFTQIIEGQSLALAHLEEAQVDAESLILEMELPAMQQGLVLLFYTKDIQVRVLLEGEELYRFQMEEGFAFLETPGDKWNGVEIPVEAAGKTVRIEMTSNFSNRYETTLAQMYLVDESDTLGVVLSQDGFRIVMSIIIAVMAIWAYGNGLIWKRRAVRRYFIRLGTLYLCAALWLASMCVGLDYLIGSPIFSYLVSVIMSIFLPVAVYEVLRVVYAKESRMLNCFEVLVWGNFALQMILQFVFHISLLDLLPLTYVVYGLGAAAAMVLIIAHLSTRDDPFNVPLVSLLIMLFGAVVEIVVLVTLPERTDLIGVASIVGLVLYLVINYIYSLVKEAHIDVQNITLEREYHRLQSTTLMRQIKAHFFFNTLNTISALCKQDAKEADKAILIFANYMRAYMRLINQHENIPLEKELEIVNLSLEIETIRFPESFVYEIQLECRDIMIPPLSIQPIVENSMIHGLRNKGKQGVITIQTKKCVGYNQIIISDNGVGFDTNMLEDGESVALKNLEKRLYLMARGEMKIISELGKGTKTIFTIPTDSLDKIG